MESENTLVKFTLKVEKIGNWVFSQGCFATLPRADDSNHREVAQVFRDQRLLVLFQGVKEH